MGEISDEQMEDIKEAFEVFTRTADQEIGYDQVGDMLRVLKFNPSNEDVMKLLGGPTKEEMSTKLLKFDEFLPLYAKALTEIISGTYDDLLEGLRVFDREGNGTVMGAEVRHVLRTLGEKMTIADINSVMDGREDMNGVINVEVFCKYLVEEKVAES